MRRPRDRDSTAGTRYTLRERMFSIGDDFWIETEGGERAFKVDGKALRIRDTLVFESRSGEELFSIRAKMLTVRDRYEIQRDGHTAATVKKALIGIRDRYSIEVDGGDDLSAKGNFVDHEYEIERAGDTVAEVSKRWFRVRDTYTRWWNSHPHDARPAMESVPAAEHRLRRPAAVEPARPTRGYSGT
jgi:uncharacterized protein YxjI